MKVDQLLKTTNQLEVINGITPITSSGLKMRNPFFPTEERLQTARKVDILLTANYTARTEVCADIVQKVCLAVFRRKDIFRGMTKRAANLLGQTQKMILIQNEKHLGYKLDFVTEAADRYIDRMKNKLDNLKGMYVKLFTAQGLSEENAQLLSHLMVTRYFVGFCESAGREELAYMLKMFQVSPSLKETQGIIHDTIKRLYKQVCVLADEVAKSLKYEQPLDHTCSTPLIRKWQVQIEDYVLNYNNLVGIVEELDKELKEKEVEQQEK